MARMLFVSYCTILLCNVASAWNRLRDNRTEDVSLQRYIQEEINRKIEIALKPLEETIKEAIHGTKECVPKHELDMIWSELNEIFKTETKTEVQGTVSTGHSAKQFLVAFLESRNSQEETELNLTITTKTKSKVFLWSLHPGVTREHNFTSSITLSLPSSLMAIGTAIQNKAVLITSTEDIDVYGMVHTQYSGGEGFYAIPIRSFDTSYVVFNMAMQENSSFIVMACNDYTIIEIRLKITPVIYRYESEEKGSVLFQSKKYFDGDVIKVNLWAYQVLQVKSIDSLSGTVINSNHPVGVISGHPYGSPRCGAAPNYQLEFIPPLKSLGKRFIVPRAESLFTTGTHYTYVDIHGSLENIQPKLNWSYCEGESFKIPVQIDSEIPLLLGISPLDIRQHNTFTLIPALDQFSNDYNLHTPSLVWFKHYILIIVQSDLVDGLKFDGKDINDYKTITTFTDNTRYKIISMEITQGFHTIRHLDPESKFGVICFGISETENYSYPGALYLR